MVQYLTEVRRTKSFVGEKIELKLLARNTSENNWIAINTDQIVTIADANMVKDLKDGQLAMADLVGNNDVKSVQDASRRLVQTLQNFGRLQEKFRQGEEEIEQWKQSLTFQTQELQKRELEVEDRERELERLEARKEEIEAQVEQFDRERAELEKLRAEVTKIRSENAAKEKEFAERATALTSDQAQELQQLVQHLSGAFGNVDGIDGIRSKILACLDTIYERQEILNGFWRDMEVQRPRVGQLQQEVDGARRLVEQLEQEWKQTQTVLTEAQLEVKLKRETIDRQESTAQVLRTAFQTQEEVSQTASGALSQLSGPGQLLPPEEVKRLEEVSLEELENIIASTHAELEKSIKFVTAQEEELASLEGEIADLSQQINQANEFEKLELENQKEFTDEEYKMLEDSIESQRRSLKEKEFILAQQRQILEKRMGTGAPDAVDLFRPIVQELGTMAQQTKEALDSIQSQIDKTRSSVQQQETIINDLKLSQQRKMQEVRAAEEQLFARIALLAEVQSNLSTLEKLLRPVQDIIDMIRPNMEAARDELAQSSSTTAAQPILQQLEQKIAVLLQDEPNW